MYNFFLQAYDLNDIPVKFQLYWERIFDTLLPCRQVNTLTYNSVFDTKFQYGQMKNSLHIFAHKKNSFYMGIGKGLVLPQLKTQCIFFGLFCFVL